jgi:predicted ATPase
MAVSGTHCCGKSTLIDALLRDHVDYAHEPEAYEALQDILGEAFAAEPSAEDFFRQLAYHVERLAEYRQDDRVIFERCAVDYLAYLLALADLGREGADAELARRALTMTRDAVRQLDLIVFVRAEDDDVHDSEDPELRSTVDTLLEGVLVDDDLGMFAAGQPEVLEVFGTTPQRLRAITARLR